MARMNDVRSILETILMRRVSNALSALPDGGRRATPERAETVQITVEKFVDDIQTVVESEFERYCVYEAPKKCS